MKMFKYGVTALTLFALAALSAPAHAAGKATARKPAKSAVSPGDVASGITLKLDRYEIARVVRQRRP